MTTLNFPTNPSIGVEYTFGSKTWVWDGIAWGLKQNQPAVLLDLIKTVDGAGSGLDADILDGVHASSFYLANNPSGYTNNTGTVTSVGATSPLVTSGGTTPSLSIPAATASVNGYMSSAYASKLDGIAAGATNVTNTNQLTNGAGYITSAGSITGNANTATILQTARTINGVSFDGSANIDTTEWFHSDRDFPNGTLITTNINYAVTNGDPFVLEIRGNSYGGIIPLDLLYQGYIYSNTIINHGGVSNGLNITGLVAINNGGNLCFWFPSQGYWHGYNVKVYVPYATRATNRVTSITGVVKPTTTKEVALSANIRQSLYNTGLSSGGGGIGIPTINSDGTFEVSRYIDFHNAGGDAVDFTVRLDGGGAGSTTLSLSGNFTASGNVTAYSDESLKTDWNNLGTNFVEQLAAIKSGTYTRIDTSERQAGNSAQDWQKLLPEVVSTNSEGILSLAYGNAALVSSVELAKRVVEQDKRIAELERLVSKLIGD